MMIEKPSPLMCAALHHIVLDYVIKLQKSGEPLEWVDVRTDQTVQVNEVFALVNKWLLERE